MQFPSDYLHTELKSVLKQFPDRQLANLLGAALDEDVTPEKIRQLREKLPIEIIEVCEILDAIGYKLTISKREMRSEIFLEPEDFFI